MSEQAPIYGIEDALKQADDLGARLTRKRAELHRVSRLFTRRLDKIRTRFEGIAGPLLIDIATTESDIKRIHRAIKERGGKATYKLPTVTLRSAENQLFYNWPTTAEDKRTVVEALRKAGPAGMKLLRVKYELDENNIKKVGTIRDDATVSIMVDAKAGEILVLPLITAKRDTRFTVTPNDDDDLADLDTGEDDDDGSSQEDHHPQDDGGTTDRGDGTAPD